MSGITFSVLIGMWAVGIFILGVYMGRKSK